jgi:hypothetical protein
MILQAARTVVGDLETESKHAVQQAAHNKPYLYLRADQVMTQCM